jgi:hypothetical protein
VSFYPAGEEEIREPPTSRFIGEIKRRVTGPLPDEASLLRLPAAIPIEIGNEWETGRRYMTVKELIRL